MDKAERLLVLYRRLSKGETIRKADLVNEFGVSERSVQRDIESLRNVLYEKRDSNTNLETVEYDHKEKGYRLERQRSSVLTSSELLAVGKILLDSRSLPKPILQSILNKLYEAYVLEDTQKQVEELLRNEMYNYVEPRHGIDVLPSITEIAKAIREKRYVTIEYLRNKDKTIVTRRVKPAGICFSEYYFYMVAFIDDKELQANFAVPDDPFPTIYRIDRIQSLVVERERFSAHDYSKQFKEGEFKQRIQFMYGGRLRRVEFTYTGADVDAILDRLPTAEIKEHQEGTNVYRLRAEVFGDGIEWWIRSQGSALTDVVFK